MVAMHSQAFTRDLGETDGMINAQTQKQVGLLVDDDPLNLLTLQRSLVCRGIQTITARGTASALIAAKTVKPAFALIDLKLGADSGLTLIQPFRSIHQQMRILLVTGYASVATAVQAIKLGADDYLPKPVDIASIIRAIGPDDQARTSSNQAHHSPQLMTPLNRLQWEHIQQALHETGGNISAAARLLGMHRRSLQRKLTKRPSPQPIL